MNPEFADFADFVKLLKKFELLEKFELHERGFELTEERRANSCLPWPISIYKLNMTSMVWNTSFGQLGYLPGWLCCLPAPAQLLIS